MQKEAEGNAQVAAATAAATNKEPTVENPLPFQQYQYTVYTNSLCTWSFEHAADDA